MRNTKVVLVVYLTFMCACSVEREGAREKFELYLKPELGAERIIQRFTKMSREYRDEGFTQHDDISEKYKISFLGVDAESLYEVEFEFVGYIQDRHLESGNERVTLPPIFSNGYSQQLYFEAILGESVILKIDKYGRVIDIEGIEALQEKADEALDLGDVHEILNLSEEEEIEMLENERLILSEKLSRKAVSTMVTVFLAVYPETVVSVGDTWQNWPENNHPDIPYREHEFELTNVTEREVHIRNAVHVAELLNGFNARGEVRGRIVLDKQSGLIKRYSTSGNLEFEGGDNKGGGPLHPKVDYFVHNVTMTFSPVDDQQEVLASLK